MTMEMMMQEMKSFGGVLLWLIQTEIWWRTCGEYVTQVLAQKVPRNAMHGDAYEMIWGCILDNQGIH